MTPKPTQPVRLADLYQLENRAAVRVTYRDTDQMGVVYYANHLVWFEIGRTELIREMGMTYRDMEREGVYLPVVSATVNYRNPARYDDLVEVRTRITKLSRASITFDYRIVRADEDSETLIATGTTRHGFLDREGRITERGFELLGVVA